MTQGLLTVSYLAASILFIRALGGLSHPERATMGNVYGMIGMAIALIATIWGAQIASPATLIGAMAIGALIGIIVSARVQMTSMPELVAILHSFVGLAAVLVGFASYLDPAAH